MEAAEAVIRAGLLRLGGSMLGEVLSADRGHRGPRVPCGRGHEAAFAGYRDKVIDTVLGPVTLTRAWYHCAACGHGFAPRDAELGVAGASMSPGLAAMNDRAAAAVPFAQAASLLEELAGVRLTAKRAERAAEASGAAAAAAGRDRARLIAARKLVPLPPSPLPDTLYAVIDGTGVPMTPKETAGREGKGEDGRARTREVKLAVFFTQDRLDEDGYPVRDRDSTSVIATFEPAAMFGNLVKAEGIRRGADHVRQLTILGTAPPGSGTSPPASSRKLSEATAGPSATSSSGSRAAGVCLADMVISRFIQHVDEVEDRCGCSEWHCPARGWSRGPSWAVTTSRSSRSSDTWPTCRRSSGHRTRSGRTRST
jgi:hypothetical protein